MLNSVVVQQDHIARLPGNQRPGGIDDLDRSLEVLGRDWGAIAVLRRVSLVPKQRKGKRS